MVAVIPAKGEIKYVCPAFEEGRFRELIKIGSEVLIWHEDESPFQKIILSIKKAGFSTGKIGIEEQVRFFIADGLQKVTKDFQIISGDKITIPCRQIEFYDTAC